METVRKIIHIDMDAFYVSVEQRDNPELRGKPVAVGGSRERGVVAAASYEARKFGVRSAMPSVTAKKKCPGLIFITPRFDVYRSVSKQIMEIFFDYTDLVEPLSLDEAFLDVTQDKKEYGSATLIAKEIKQRIKSEVDLTASAGVSVNKFLAKIASDYKKPDGFFVIKPEDAEKFVETLPIEKFFGVGKVTAEKMHRMGIDNGMDLKKISYDEMIRNFGKVGAYYFNIARGVDNREVNPDRIRKSVGAERTFDTDLIGLTEILQQLSQIEMILHERLERNNFRGRTLTLKVKFDNFTQITRSKSYIEPLSDRVTIHNTAEELARSISYGNRGVRLLGLAVSNLGNDEKYRQLSLDL